MSGHYADFLFVQPSFLEGWARLFDFAGALNLYNDSPTAELADRQALAADWAAVGEALRDAIARFEQECPQARELTERLS